MSDTRKLAAFVRSAVREGVLDGIDHPFSEAASNFTAEVDILGRYTVDGWFKANEKKVKAIEVVYEAYNKEVEPNDAPETDAQEANGVLDALGEIKEQIKALKENKEEVEEEPKEEEAETSEED
jgi:hypothetical protein